jgi:glycosyltransferase involved in cell wall biosynthesis
MKSSPKEIKIYAQNINTGGALILLETLIQHILHVNLKVIVRVYIGSEKSLRMSHSRLVCVELPSLFDKMKVMFKRDKHAIYFGNLPPARQAQHSLLYIHNYYIAAPQEELLADPTISWRTKIKYVACRKYINLFAQNTSAIACQTSLMRSYMGQCLLPGQEIDVFPFYRSVKGQDKKKDTDFCYVGLPSAHKNHERLLQAFALLSEVKCQTSCIMTIPESPQNQHLLRQIAKINREGYVTIENRGYISYEEASEN